MAILEADVANPPPGKSHIPEESLLMSAQLAKPKLDTKIAEALVQFRRAANYIAAGTQFKSSFPQRDQGADLYCSHDLPWRQYPCGKGFVLR